MLLTKRALGRLRFLEGGEAGRMLGVDGFQTFALVNKELEIACGNSNFVFCESIWIISWYL
jgi:hypothetical protein